VPGAPAVHVRLVVPDEGEAAPRLPKLVDGRPQRPEGDPTINRDYTLRNVDAAARTIAIDFVVHDHGPAGRWAAAARPGDLLGVCGPRGSKVFPLEAERYVLVVDETSQPAAANWVEGPFAGPMTVLAFGTGWDALPAFAERPDLDVRRIDARGAEAGEAVVAELASLALGPDAFVFAAGEADALRVVRRRLFAELGLPRASADITGYWRDGVAGLDHHSALEPDAA
jgi:NADPH-dependent ferric siderophore reductase